MYRSYGKRVLIVLLISLIFVLSVSKRVFADDENENDIIFEMGDNYWIDDGSEDGDEYYYDDDYWIDDGSEVNDDSSIIDDGNYWEDDGTEEIIEEPEEEEPIVEEDLVDLYYYEDLLAGYVPLSERLQPFILADDNNEQAGINNNDNSTMVAIIILTVSAFIMLGLLIFHTVFNKKEGN